MFLRWDESEPLDGLRTRFTNEAFTLSQNSLGRDVWILERPKVLALLDHIRWQAIKGALERIAGMDPLAVYPGLPVLPVNIIAEKDLVKLLDVVVI